MENDTEKKRLSRCRRFLDRAWPTFQGSTFERPKWEESAEFSSHEAEPVVRMRYPIWSKEKDFVSSHAQPWKHFVWVCAQVRGTPRFPHTRFQRFMGCFEWMVASLECNERANGFPKHWRGSFCLKIENTVDFAATLIRRIFPRSFVMPAHEQDLKDNNLGLYGKRTIGNGPWYLGRSKGHFDSLRPLCTPELKDIMKGGRNRIAYFRMGAPINTPTKLDKVLKRKRSPSRSPVMRPSAEVDDASASMALDGEEVSIVDEDGGSDSYSSSLAPSSDESDTECSEVLPLACIHLLIETQRVDGEHGDEVDNDDGDVPMVQPEGSSEDATEEPGSEDATEEPGSEDAAEEPGSEDATEEPGSEDATEEPGSEDATEEPGSEDATEEAESEDATEEAESEDATEEAESEDATEEAESEDAAEEPGESCDQIRNASTNDQITTQCSQVLLGRGDVMATCRNGSDGESRDDTSSSTSSSSSRAPVPSSLIILDDVHRWRVVSDREYLVKILPPLRWSGKHYKLWKTLSESNEEILISKQSLSEKGQHLPVRVHAVSLDHVVVRVQTDAWKKSLVCSPQKKRRVSAARVAMNMKRRAERSSTFSRPVLYREVAFRSTLEARHAVFLDTCGVRWEYEPRERRVRWKNHMYTPDFYLPDMNIVLEVKPRKPADDAFAKCREVSRQFPDDTVYMVIGNMKCGFSLDDRKRSYAHANGLHGYSWKQGSEEAVMTHWSAALRDNGAKYLKLFTSTPSSESTSLCDPWLLDNMDIASKYRFESL